MQAEWVVVMVAVLGGVAVLIVAIRHVRHRHDHSATPAPDALLADRSATERAVTRDGPMSTQIPARRDDPFAVRRREMVRIQLQRRDIFDARVLEAMRRVPRHEFVPRYLADEAYQDRPLPIGHQQTISQPYIVALMTQLARPRVDSIALDVGTGSGYQAAVLAELCKEVYSIEIVEPLATSARQRLARLGYENITVRRGDGYQGWIEHAPYDLIIVAAAPDHIPQPLVEQIKPGGCLVIPVGRHYQTLCVVEKKADGRVQRRSVVPVTFVPMTGQALRSTN